MENEWKSYISDSYEDSVIKAMIILTYSNPIIQNKQETDWIPALRIPWMEKKKKHTWKMNFKNIENISHAFESHKSEKPNRIIEFS